MNNFRQRSRARKFALQALYQWHINPSTTQTLIDQFQLQHIQKKVDWMLFCALVNGVTKQAAQLKVAFSPYLDRELTNLDIIETQLLMLATFELMYHPETPALSIIDDAIHLARDFGAQDSYKFVNAILDKVAKSIPLRQHEFSYKHVLSSTN